MSYIAAGNTTDNIVFTTGSMGDTIGNNDMITLNYFVTTEL
jgi:hypothetical protein